MIIGKKINEDYAWEFTLFYKYRSLDDGLSLFEFKSDIDWYDGDHCPKADISLRLFNWTIFEFNVYNVHHADTMSDIQKQCWDNYHSTYTKKDFEESDKAFIEHLKQIPE
jgi:hypothetical protein